MNARLPRLAACALTLAVSARAAFDDAPVFESDASWPDAGSLVRGVVAALPDVAVLIHAQLQTRDRLGSVERALNAEMRLDWYGQPPSARYRIRDAFGEDIQSLLITWPEPGRPDFQWGSDAPAADLYEAIEGTDFSWMDLSLTFLWWPGGRTVGMERIKGRTCYIVDLPAPDGSDGAYAGVRLWIDPRIHLMLQAVAYDARGDMLRLLEVKSFKKVGEVWVIQNLDVQSFPGRSRTSLRVRKVAVAGGETAVFEGEPEQE